MGKFRRTVVESAILVAGGIYIYRNVLTPETKAKLSSMKDAVSGAVFRQICHRAEVPFQTFANRSDMAGGSTLGNISQSQVSLNTVDIGLPQLAMHSPFETAGAEDTAYLVRAAKELFSCSVQCLGDGELKLSFST